MKEPEIYCPKCQWRPRAENRWACVPSCGIEWNTFWTGGVFVHVPRGEKIEKPIQIIWQIDEPGTAQYAQTLAVVDELAECEIREYFLAPDFEGQALHAGSFELFVGAAANARVDANQHDGAGTAQGSAANPLQRRGRRD